MPGDGSESHVSTGSTVKTFLTQDDLAPPYSPYEPSMADIDEVRSENGDGGDNGGGDNIWSRICFVVIFLLYLIVLIIPLVCVNLLKNEFQRNCCGSIAGLELSIQWLIEGKQAVDFLTSSF